MNEEYKKAIMEETRKRAHTPIPHIGTWYGIQLTEFSKEELVDIILAMNEDKK